MRVYPQALLFAQLEGPGDSRATGHVFRVDLASVRPADEEQHPVHASFGADVVDVLPHLLRGEYWVVLEDQVWIVGEQLDERGGVVFEDEAEELLGVSTKERLLRYDDFVVDLVSRSAPSTWKEPSS